MLVLILATTCRCSSSAGKAWALQLPAHRLLVRRRRRTRAAGKKAFIANRIGDFGLLVRDVPARSTTAARSTGTASRRRATSSLHQRRGQVHLWPIGDALARLVLAASLAALGCSRARRRRSPPRPLVGLVLFLGCDRQERADPALRLAARRDGRPDAGLRAHPRGHDGHRRRLPHLPPLVRVRALARRR